MAQYSVQDRLNQFGKEARARMQPAFAREYIEYPPQEATLVAFKLEKRLELYAKDKNGKWRFIKNFPICMLSGGSGPKLRQGDLQVPEGMYGIELLNPNSSYHVSLRLDYPNAYDRKMAHQDKRSDLGSDIMIHGKCVSIGCLAMGDSAAEELFTLASDVGLAHTHVIIAPWDMRYSDIAKMHLPPTVPTWTLDLYQSIATELKHFPVTPTKKE